MVGMGASPGRIGQVALVLLVIGLLWLLPAEWQPYSGLGAAEDRVLAGKVIGVTDGDSLRVLVGTTPVEVRLQGIDAPERGQSYGQRAKQAFSTMVAGKNVQVRKTGEDRYGRTLGVVTVQGVDVNRRLVEDGWAWHYQQYSNDAGLERSEQSARAARRGLWADERPIPPWEYRSRQRTGAAERTTRATQGDGRYWLNTGSNVRHNAQCEYFQNTRRGRFCSANEGKPCGACGG